MKCGWVAVEKVGVIPDEPADVNLYCGRTEQRTLTAQGFMFADLGNPYPINLNQTRPECLARYKAEFYARETPRSLVWWDAVEWIHRTARAGQTVRLWCHCKPQACHCDTIQHEAVLRLIFPETPETPYSWEQTS